MNYSRHLAGGILMVPLWLGCASGWQPRVDPQNRLALKLDVRPNPAHLGDRVKLEFTLLNTGPTSIGICRTSDWGVMLGSINRRTVSAHKTCVAANRKTLESGGQIGWGELIELSGECDPKAIEQHPFLAKYSLCPGSHVARADALLFVGTKCTRRRPCTRYRARAETTVVVRASER